MVEVKNIPRRLRKKGLGERLQKLCEENDVVFMAIFGSFVRGKQRKRSDVDIAIEYEEGSRKSLFDLVDLEEKLRKLLHRRVDLGILGSINPYIIDHVRKEMKVIYEKG
jgi:predicted nucleotidyltransferase